MPAPSRVIEVAHAGARVQRKREESTGDGRYRGVSRAACTAGATKGIGSNEAWVRSVGRMWARLLRRAGLDPEAAVAEIGPGFSAKVAFGLSDLGFRGTVILVEPNEEAGAWAAAEYRRLLPDAEIRVMSEPVPDAGALAGQNTDFLVANHVIDDLLLDTYIEADERASIFGRMGPGSACSSTFVQAWHRMLATDTLSETLSEQVAANLSHYVELVRPRCLFLNDYPSWRHRQHGLEPISKVSRQTMDRLRYELVNSRADTALLRRPPGGRGFSWLVSPS